LHSLSWRCRAVERAVDSCEKLCSSVLECAPDVLGAVGEEDESGHPLRKRGLQHGHDRQILSDLGAVEGIGHNDPHTFSSLGRDHARRVGGAPVNEAVQVTAAKES
jgi:hypothetical protein